MKKVIVLHGTMSTPKDFWYPYIKNSINKSNFEVFIPQLPNKDNPEYKEQRDFVLNNFNLDKDTILVGHSAGCPLLLSILEKIDFKICKSILVAGFYYKLGEEKEAVLQDEYNWKKIKNNSKHFIFINSVNDPWGCNEKHGKFAFDKLGGDLIIKSNDGHFGSVKYNQPYKEFLLLKFLIEN